ncbi:MAG: hypothetical protein GY759_16615, partial [Chloroflexi bacterium]|nr:hypothetical protein [Chloroflexota bacterium]
MYVYARVARFFYTLWERASRTTTALYYARIGICSFADLSDANFMSITLSSAKLHGWA